MRSYENPIVNIAFNIVIPALILRFFEKLPIQPLATLSIALAFPIIYGLYDFAAKREINFLSAIGFVSVLLTGGIGFFRLDALWVAITQAAVPFFIAVVTAISARTRDPLVKVLMFTDSFLDTTRIGKRLEERGTRREFDRVFELASYLLALSFLVSTVLNYVLARILVNAKAGTALFNEQLGHMYLLSFVVIALPMLVFMVLIAFFIVRRLERATGLPWEELLVSEHGAVPVTTRDGEEHGADDEPHGEADEVRNASLPEDR